ncbi:hypothetical protein BpHYR1_029570 [Brachionus plicatilis]|uniref:Uncharacterized protein n=1 Tax=Brachionus plicatilis TaxID=10195 RepID=A0A3M7P8R8_BRAPC|nr:hypothetical protein BpHYR1_029570 [Brachionus plicatilis]
MYMTRHISTFYSLSSLSQLALLETREFVRGFQAKFLRPCRSVVLGLALTAQLLESIAITNLTGTPWDQKCLQDRHVPGCHPLNRLH